MPRELTGITDEILQKEEEEFYAFVKVEFPHLGENPFRFTNRPGGFVGNIDGSSKTWTEVIWTYGPFKQSQQDVFTVNWIEFADLDDVWKNLDYQYSVLNVPTTIYKGRWDVSVNPSVFLSAFIIYEGRMDEGEFTDSARIVLKPHHTPWEQLIPPGKMAGKCTNDYRNPEDCQYSGAEPVDPATGLPQVTCGKTRYDCRLRANEIHINIYDDLPKPGESIVVGGIRHGLPPAPANQ